MPTLITTASVQAVGLIRTVDEGGLQDLQLCLGHLLDDIDTSDFVVRLCAAAEQITRQPWKWFRAVRLRH